MEYHIKFLIIVFISAFLGILIGIINNDIVTDKQEIKNDNSKMEINNNISDDINQINKKTDENQNKNDILFNDDLINESDEEEEKKADKKENDIIDTETDIKDKEKNIKEKETGIKEKEKDIKDKEKDIKEKEKDIKDKETDIKDKETDIKDKEKDIKEKETDIKEKEKKINPNNINYIHIALTIDNNYLYPLLVFLTSLFDNRANSTFYIIHIPHSKNLRQEYFTKINSIIEKQGKGVSNITYYNMSDDFKGATTGTHIPITSYYRIALPSLLPYVDKIIYIDTDVINFKDLSEMYSIELKDKIYFCGTLDDVGFLNELKSLGIYTKKYINAGILLMNLKGMRKDGIEEKIRNFIFTHYLDHHDQTAINGACYDNFEILSVKYAILSFDSLESLRKWNNKQDKLYRYNDLELQLGFYEPTLLHYAGWTKPWDIKYNNIKGIYWWYYAKKSMFYEEILKNYNFGEYYVEKLLKKIPEDGGLLKRNYKNIGNK